MNASGVMPAGEFFNGESNEIAVRSFSESQDGGFVVIRRFIGFAVVLNQ